MSSLNSTEREYIQEHEIEGLLSYLAAGIILTQPEKPEESILASLKALKFKGTRISFTDEELRAIFDGLDVSRSGRVRKEEIRSALRSLSLGPSFRGELDQIEIPENVDAQLFIELVRDLLPAQFSGNNLS